MSFHSIYSRRPMTSEEKGFPPEFAIYLPFFSDAERKHLDTVRNQFTPSSSMEKVKVHLLDILPKLDSVSNMFLFVTTKILFEVGELETLVNLSYSYDSPYIDVWHARLMLHQGLIKEVLQMVDNIKKNKSCPKLVNLHCNLLLALAQFQLGNRKQGIYYLEQLFAESVKTPGINEDEKLIFNDVLLEAHELHVYQNRFQEEFIKLENRINVALQIANELNHRNHTASLYNQYAIILRETGQLEKALEYQNKALDLFIQTGYLRMIGACKGNLGSIYMFLQDYEKASALLLDALEIFKYLEERRNIAYIERFLGDIHAEQGELLTAIKRYKKAIQILEEVNIVEPIIYCILAELYIRTEQESEFNVLMNIIEEIIKNEPESIIVAYYYYLKGVYETTKVNIGTAKDFLHKAVKITDKVGWSILSAKILISMLNIELKTIKLPAKEEQISAAQELIKQLEPFLREKKRKIEYIELLLISTTLNILKEDEISAIGNMHQITEIMKEIGKKNIEESLKETIEEVKKTIFKIKDKSLKQEQILSLLNQSKREFRLFRIHYTKEEELAHPTPLALLILHRSGIPLRSYVISRRTVKDQILFGGFITAVQDLIQELFREKATSKIMVISYGNYKILIERSIQEFSVVIVAARDSFILRRKLHALVSLLDNVTIPTDFYGELEEKTRQKIDEAVSEIFEEELDISDIGQQETNV